MLKYMQLCKPFCSFEIFISTDHQCHITDLIYLRGEIFACDHFRNHIIGYVLPSVKRFHVFLQPLAPRTKCKTESRGVCLTSLSQPCIKGRRRSWCSTFFRFNHTTLSYLLTITKPNSCVRIFLPGSGGNGNGNASYRKK